MIEAELAEHDARLAELPRMLALSKADLVAPEAAEAAAARVARAAGRGRAGARHLERDAAGARRAARASCCAASRCAEPALRRGAPGRSEVAEFQVFRPGVAPRLRGRAPGARGFRVSGDAVERLIARHDLENEEALAHVEHRLRRMGVIAALEAEGFEPGDDVEIGGVVFELDPGAPF